MSAAESETIYDIVIIGGGLSGLTSGMILAKSDFKIAILEKQSRWGGLCGSTFIDGGEFVIACNDFGLSMEKECKALGLPIEFQKPKTLIYYEGKQYSFPPQTVALVKGWRNAPQVFRYIKKLFFKRKRSPEENNLEGLINGCFHNQALKDLLKLPAYLMGVKPSDFETDALLYDFKYKYGYRQPTTPKGGPQVLVDAMLEYLNERVTLQLNTEVEGIETKNNIKTVKTNKGCIYAKEIITTQQQKFNESDVKEGLPLSMFYLGIDENFRYPENVHTIVNYPGNPEYWFGKLDNGQFTDEFGFHIFKSDLQVREGRYTVNVYFYLPREVQDRPEDKMVAIEKYIFGKLEEILPGINEALVYKRFVSPGEFKANFGLSSKVTPYIVPAGTSKPANFDSKTGIHQAGNSYYPPGDHVGAAILSANIAASLVREKLTHVPNNAL